MTIYFTQKSFKSALRKDNLPEKFPGRDLFWGLSSKLKYLWALKTSSFTSEISSSAGVSTQAFHCSTIWLSIWWLCNHWLCKFWNELLSLWDLLCSKNAWCCTNAESLCCCCAFYLFFFSWNFHHLFITPLHGSRVMQLKDFSLPLSFTGLTC